MRGVVAVVLLAWPCVAAAEPGRNWLVGPVLGVSLHDGAHVLFGGEGGYGDGPERANLGIEHRASKLFMYAELDPWWYVGGTLGAGIDSDGTLAPVLGVWEGMPLDDGPSCDAGWHYELTVAVGYRYTGVHELYMSMKAGMLEGTTCVN
jgi:hypothetical protein